MNVLTTTAGLLFISFCSSRAQIVSVCEVLRELEDLNQKEVRIRGTWSVGDLGEALTSIDPCERPTVRDGWVWKDVLQVDPMKEAKGFSLEYYNLIKKIPRAEPARVIATLTGRLETREHFDVVRGRPVAYGYFVALLRYSEVEDLEVIPYKPGELERELKWRRKPLAVRLR